MSAHRLLWNRLAHALAGFAWWLAAGCASTPDLPKGNPHSLAIGAVLPLSGPNALLGQSLKHGLELGVADINASGGVNGQNLTLGVIDSQSDLTDGALALQTWREREVPIILVGDNNLAIDQADNLADYSQLIGFLCNYVAVPSLTPKNGVRVYLNGDQEARAIEGYIAAAGVNKAAILYVSNNSGLSNAKYLEFLINGDYITPYKDGYTATERDFRILADAMRRLDAGALILVGYGPEYASILAAFDFDNWKGLTFGYMGQGSLAGLGNQPGLAAATLYPVPAFAVNPRGTPAGQAFVDKYRAIYGQDPDLPAAYAYDNIHVLAIGATQAASLQPLKIRAGFIALKSYTGAAGTYAIRPDGDTEMPLQLVTGNGQPAPPPPKPTEAPAMSNVPMPAAGFSTNLMDQLTAPPAAGNITLKPSGNTTTGNTTGPATTPSSATPGNTTTPGNAIPVVPATAP
jgi:branched-chain amino acid transport system substrate-binding protein